jgi:hypothetical protein
MSLGATASEREVIITEESSWGDIKPLRVLRIAEAQSLYDGLSRALKEARVSDLEYNKRRLEQMKAEVARLEAQIR